MLSPYLRVPTIRYSYLIATALCLLCTLLWAVPAQAQTADSSAFGESVDLTADTTGGIVTVTSGPLPQVAGTAPPNYNLSDSAASASASSATLGGEVLGTGVLTVTASSDVAATFVDATSTVDDLDLRVVPDLAALLLSLTADTVASRAEVMGSCDSGLVATGTTTLANANVAGDAADTAGATGAVTAAPAPNTVLLDAAGIRVVLNEQLVSGNGTDSSAITVNAIHISFDAVALEPLSPTGRILDGDIIVAQSQARFRCSLGTDGSADVGVTITDNPDPVAPGSPLTYTLDVSNDGPDTATDVTVVQTLPDGVTFVSADPSQGTCTQQGQVLSCDLGNVAPGATPAIDVTVVPIADGVLTTVATVSANEPDPDTSNNSDQEQTVVGAGAATGSADLAITKTVAPQPAQVGDDLVYTVVVTNGGPDPAVDTTVTDVLPAAFAFDSATPDQGTCSESLQVVTCNLGTVPAAGSVSIIIEGAALATGTFGNSASVFSATPDPDLSNNFVVIASPVIEALPSIADIPTLDSLGLLVLVGLLGAFGYGLLLRRA